jgi:hypothetical protein
MARRPMSAEHRANMAAAVRAAMARPEVRAKVSQRTREGQRAAADGAARALREAWHRASPAIRRKFLCAVVERLCHIEGDSS